MFDIIDPLGIHHILPFRSQNNIPHNILHDGMILLHHGISLYMPTIFLLITGGLKINDVSHHCNIDREYMRSLSLSESTMRSCMSLFLQKILTIPCRPFPTYYNISRNINMIYWIN
jgi:hypothetical protein